MSLKGIRPENFSSLILLRMRSLSFLAEGGLGIPVVLVVVEGGTDAIADARSSLEHRIPVVVCSGTGRAADILAYAYNHTKTVSG